MGPKPLPHHHLFHLYGIMSAASPDRIRRDEEESSASTPAAPVYKLKVYQGNVYKGNVYKGDVYNGIVHKGDVSKGIMHKEEPSSLNDTGNDSLRAG